MNKRVIIVSNGTLYPQIIGEIHKDDFVIGVDRGAYWLIRQGIIPSIAIGDFDSTTKGELMVIKNTIPDTRIFRPKKKDFTDTELAALIAIKGKPKQIVILGGSGSRKDHELATIGLLELFQRRGIDALIRDERNEMKVIGRGRTILEKRAGSRYVSIVPITSSIQISLLGFKYEITKKTIHRGQTIGISNEFTGRQATITIHRGLAFVIQSRD